MNFYPFFLHFGSSFKRGKKINLRSSSVDVSLFNLKNNLSYNMDHIKQNNKELNMNYINNNCNKYINKNDKFKAISGSLSNPNREKITYKLKSSAGINSSSMMIKKNNTRKREISGLYNNYSYKNHNNYIQLNKFNAERKNEFPFYLPNLNKNSNILNLYGFKKKAKINLNQLKFKLNLNNYNHDFINHNNNKIFLSPTNKRLKKSESTSFLKSPLNSNKFNYGNNSNLLSPKIKRNFSNSTNKNNKISNDSRNISSSKRKRIKNSNEG